MAAAAEASVLDTGQKEASGPVMPNGPARGQEDFMYFVAKMNASSSPHSPSDPAANRSAHQQYHGGEIIVPSVAHHTVESGEEDHPPVPAIPPPAPPHLPRPGVAPYAQGPPQLPTSSHPLPQPPLAGPPMAYVPREIALATVVALMISSNPWISAQELDSLIKTQHPALYDPYSVPSLIQMQLMIAQNLRNGVKFVAAGDPKLPPPPLLPDPRSSNARGAGGPSPGAMPVQQNGPPPPRPPCPPPPPPGPGGHPMHMPPQAMMKPLATSSPRLAPGGETTTTATARTPIPTVNEPEKGDTAQGGALAQATRVPKKRVMSPGVSSWSNFTQADFVNKKKRKRRSLSPGAPQQGLLSPVEATEQTAA